MNITKELHQAIVSTINKLTDAKYTIRQIQEIRLVGEYFILYKKTRTGSRIIACTPYETVRQYYTDLSEEISAVLSATKYGELLTK